NFDLADNVPVELRQFFRGNPELPVDRRTNRLGRVSTCELGLHPEACDVAAAVPFGVPVPSNLRCIFLVEDRVEDWLTRKARWELSPPRVPYERELLWPYGAV